MSLWLFINDYGIAFYLSVIMNLQTIKAREIKQIDVK